MQLGKATHAAGAPAWPAPTGGQARRLVPHLAGIIVSILQVETILSQYGSIWQ